MIQPTSSKIAAFASKDLTSKSAKQHICNYILANSIPRIVTIDHGQEFKKGLDTELASLNVSLEATTPYVKGTTAVAETSLRLRKTAMKKACLYILVR